MTEPATEAEKNAVSPAYGIFGKQNIFLYTLSHNEINLSDQLTVPWGLIKSQLPKVNETKH